MPAERPERESSQGDIQPAVFAARCLADPVALRRAVAIVAPRPADSSAARQRIKNAGRAAGERAARGGTIQPAVFAARCLADPVALRRAVAIVAPRPADSSAARQRIKNAGRAAGERAARGGTIQPAVFAARCLADPVALRRAVAIVAPRPADSSAARQRIKNAGRAAGERAARGGTIQPAVFAARCLADPVALRRAVAIVAPRPADSSAARQRIKNAGRAAGEREQPGGSASGCRGSLPC